MDHFNEQELRQFQEPLMLYQKVTPEALDIPNDIFFNSSNGKYQKYREAWAAALFARGFSDLVKPCKIRLIIDDTFPDFEIDVEGHTYPDPFEFTEAMAPERKRGDDYKKMKTHPRYGPAAKLADPDDAVEWICDKIKAKASRNYNPKPNLLVYANFEVAEKLDLDLLRKACAEYSSKFKSIWLLWKVFIAQVFASDAFGHACKTWSEIPDYLEECERKMGIRK